MRMIHATKSKETGLDDLLLKYTHILILTILLYQIANLLST